MMENVSRKAAERTELNYYENNYRQYFESTVIIDPAPFLEPLAELLEPGATILDIGCGSGRDLRWFAERGFSPTGFEQATNLARLAQEHSGCSVIVGDFQCYDFSSLQFSALVFIGSLVHLPKKSLFTVLRSTCQALVNDGLILITLKEGDGISHGSDGRQFTLWSTGEIETVFSMVNLNIHNFSRMASRLTPDDTWLGYVLHLRDDA